MQELSFQNYTINSPAGVRATIRVPTDSEYAKEFFNPTSLRVLADEIEAFQKHFWNEPEVSVDWTEGLTAEECDATVAQWNEESHFLLILTPEVITELEAKA